MEVLVGSTFRDRSNVTAQDQGVPAALSSRMGLRRCDRTPVGESSENEEEEEEDDDAVSSSQGRWFDSFSSSLEDSLPIKRGLSNHYIGKSKSFGNLMEVSNAKDLEKVESPLNKRRRLLIANKLRRRSSLSSFSIYSKIDPNSMPLLALQEYYLEEDHKYNDNDDDDDDDDDDESSDDETSKLKEKRMKTTTNNTRDFMVHQTKSCFSFTSFQDDDP